LSFIEKLDSVASTLDFSTVGIKEIIEQGAWDMHPGRDTDSDHAECWVVEQIRRKLGLQLHKPPSSP